MKGEKLITPLLGILLLLVNVQIVQAASYEYDKAPGKPVLIANYSWGRYFEINYGMDADILMFTDFDRTIGISSKGIASLDLGIGFSTSLHAQGGGFSIRDDKGYFLGGDIFWMRPGEYKLDIFFNNISGRAASSFNEYVLMTLSSRDLGKDPAKTFDWWYGGETFSASLTLANIGGNPVVPVQAALPLFISGIGVLSWQNLRRKNSIEGVIEKAE